MCICSYVAIDRKLLDRIIVFAVAVGRASRIEMIALNACIMAISKCSEFLLLCVCRHMHGQSDQVYMGCILHASFGLWSTQLYPSLLHY